MLHVASCSTCAGLYPLSLAEKSLLAATRATTDDVTLRRIRQRVLADAANDLPCAISASGPRRRKLRFVASVFAGAALTIVMVAWSFRIDMDRPRRYVVAVSPTTGAKGGARWSQRMVGRREVVRLEDGAFQLSIDQPHGGTEVVFHLPDGVIEDLGTVFDVAVVAGRTAHVSVRSGKVAIKLHGLPPVSLSAGGSWAPPPLAPHIAPPFAAATEAQPPPAKRPPRRPSHEVCGKTCTRHASDVTRVNESPAAEPEDVAYLHIVELARAARATEAREAASEYLQRFPRGFRREEVKRLAR